MLHGDYIAEVVICDNNPHGKHGQLLRDVCLQSNWEYRSLNNSQGTAIAKDTAVHACSHGNYVVCLDSHVLLYPGFFESMYAAIETHGAQSLFHGPLVHDNSDHVATSLNGTWEGGMCGQWQRDVMYDSGQLTFPIINAATGMFVAHRDTWMGFNARFRGFGGEEGYLQRKYLAAGRGVYCVSGAKWWHKFGRPNGTPYLLTHADKLRNYLIGWLELGLPTGEVIEAFVRENLVTRFEAMQVLTSVRLELCMSCEFRRYNECSKCNCLIDRICSKGEAKCPTNRW